jgi:hypothetical protein
VNFYDEEAEKLHRELFVLRDSHDELLDVARVTVTAVRLELVLLGDHLRALP